MNDYKILENELQYKILLILQELLKNQKLEEYSFQSLESQTFNWRTPFSHWNHSPTPKILTLGHKITYFLSKCRIWYPTNCHTMNTRQEKDTLLILSQISHTKNVNKNLCNLDWDLEWKQRRINDTLNFEMNNMYIYI